MSPTMKQSVSDIQWLMSAFYPGSQLLGGATYTFTTQISVESDLMMMSCCSRCVGGDGSSADRSSTTAVL